MPEIDSLAPDVASAAVASPSFSPSPFLHFGLARVYSPLADRHLEAGDPLYDALQRLRTGLEVAPELLQSLQIGHWVTADVEETAREFLLKYVSLEAHTVCNQACYFCPVSIAPRESHFMPMDLYERILDELSAYRSTIEAVFMINYNEPTADKRFVEQVRAIRAVGLPPGVLTNGTGLTPDRIDALVSAGGLRFLSINLSTLDRDRYQHDRGGDHLDLVLRNLDHARDQPLAEQMDIVVLGTGDENHKRDFEAIGVRFAGSRFTVKSFEVMDRAGYLEIGMRPAQKVQNLCGCENTGSRPLQHIHITPHGQCLLCCEDYDEKYVVGDLNQESVAEVLTGSKIALLRKWIYGVEESPADFICRKCVFARTA